MKFLTIKLEDKDLEFRLTSSDAIDIEKKNNTPLQKYIQQVSNTNCVNLLKYMRRSRIPNFSDKDANELFDQLVDEGYSLESIYLKIIFPACVVSGVITQKDMDKIQEAIDNPQESEESNPPQK